MKALKVIAVIIVLLVLLVVGIGVYVVQNTDRLVDTAVETFGTEYLGAPVTLGAAHVSLKEGRATLEDLKVGNPPGYEGDYAMELHEISMTLDPLATNAEHVVLQRVTVDGAKLAAVIKSPGDTNFQALIKQLESVSATGSGDSGSTSTTKLSIGRFDFTNAEASVAAPVIGKQTSVRVPDVHLENIGDGANGEPVAEVLSQVLRPIVRSLMQQAAQKQLGDSPIGNELDDAMEKLRQLGHPDA